MTEAYEIGISLALQDGVSDGIAIIRRDLAALDRAIAATSVNLARLRQAEGASAPSIPTPAPPRQPIASPAILPANPPLSSVPGAKSGAPDALPAHRPSPPAPVLPTPALAPAASAINVQLSPSPTPAAAIAPAPQPATRLPQPAPIPRSTLAAAQFVSPPAANVLRAPMLEAGILTSPTAPPAPTHQPFIAPPHLAVPASTQTPNVTPAAPLPLQSALRGSAAPTAAVPSARPAVPPPVALALPSRSQAATPLPGLFRQPPMPSPAAAPPRPTPAAGAAIAPNPRPAAIPLPVRPAAAHRFHGHAAPSASSAPGTPPAPSAPPGAAIPPAPASQGSFAPPPQTQQPITLSGDIILDGARVGRWMTSTLARQAARPPAGPTGPDPRQTPLWSGQAQGF